MLQSTPPAYFTRDVTGGSSEKVEPKSEPLSTETSEVAVCVKNAGAPMKVDVVAPFVKGRLEFVNLPVVSSRVTIPFTVPYCMSR